ncbi:MAG: hypothetical protein AB8G05_19690 [Oligoflexales bacterium]
MLKKFNFREFILNHISKLPLIVIIEITIMLTVSVNISVVPMYNMAIERELNRSEDVKKGIESTINDELYKISNIIELIAADKQVPLQVHNAFVKDEYNELRESMHIYQRGGRLSFVELVDQKNQIAFSSGLSGRFGKDVAQWDIIKNNTVERPAYGVTRIDGRVFLVSANTIIHMAEPIATIVGGIEINDIFSESLGKNLNAVINVILDDKLITGI